MSRKQVTGTALVSLNCLRSASWEAQYHQPPRPPRPGGSALERQRRALETNLMEPCTSFLSTGNELIPAK